MRCRCSEVACDAATLVALGVGAPFLGIGLTAFKVYELSKQALQGHALPRKRWHKDCRELADAAICMIPVVGCAYILSSNDNYAYRLLINASK